MSVIQVNVWSCDFCGAVASTAVATDLWDDPSVEYPDGWGTRLDGQGESDGHACPECRKGPQLEVAAAFVAANNQGTMITTEKICDGSITKEKAPLVRGRVRVE